MSNLKTRLFGARVSILIVFTVLITLVISLFVLNRQFKQFKEESIYYYNTIIEESVDRKIDLSTNSEVLFDQKAYHLMNSVSDEFSNISKDEVDSGLLNMISEKYDVTGLCILEDEVDSARILLSTVPEENGMSTDSWGFWNTAIVELFNGGPVSTEKGFHIDNFWIGPKTYSYVEKENSGSTDFYKYAYIKNPEQDYMISAIISEDTYIMDEFNLNALLEDYEEKIEFIDSVFIVDLNRLKSNDIYKEPFIIFGKDRLGLFPLISQELKSAETDLTGSRSVRADSAKYDFVLNKIPNDRYIITVLSHENALGGVFSTVVVLVVLFIVALLIVSKLINKQYSQFKNMLSLETKRGEVAMELSKTLSAIPSYVFKCVLDGDSDEVMLTFNEGSSLNDGDYLPIDSPLRPISDYYPQDFVDASREEILLGFKGVRSQFEFTISDTVYSFSVVPIYDDSDKVEKVLVTGTDVSTYIKEREKSKFMAYHDSLTGLPNRNMMNRDMTELVSSGNPSAVYYLDLDGFKSVNDKLGHDRGDSLLKDVADALSSSLADDMKLYRIGGDEFIILDPVFRDKHDLEIISQKLKKSVTSLESSLSEDISLDVSIGVALYPDHGGTKSELLSKADKAMYRSKKNPDTLYTLAE